MARVPTSLETERLRLRMFRDDDLDDYAAMCADPEVMRFVGGSVLDRAQSWRQMALLLGHWQLRGFGWWAVDSKEDGRFLGRLGLWQPEGWPGLEVGWTLKQDSWGRGFATEGAKAALTCAWRDLGAQRVVSVIEIGNHPSVAVARRIGERLLRTDTILGHDIEIYAVDRSDTYT